MADIQPINGPPQDIIDQLSHHRHSYYSIPRAISKESPIEASLAREIRQYHSSTTVLNLTNPSNRHRPSQYEVPAHPLIAPQTLPPRLSNRPFHDQSARSARAPAP